MSESHYAQCNRVLRECYDKINSLGGYVSPDDHLGNIEGESLDRVLGEIERHRILLEQTGKIREKAA